MSLTSYRAAPPRAKSGRDIRFMMVGCKGAGGEFPGFDEISGRVPDKDVRRLSNKAPVWHRAVPVWRRWTRTRRCRVSPHRPLTAGVSQPARRHRRFRITLEAAPVFQRLLGRFLAPGRRARAAGSWCSRGREPDRRDSWSSPATGRNPAGQATRLADRADGAGRVARGGRATGRAWRENAVYASRIRESRGTVCLVSCQVSELASGPRQPHGTGPGRSFR